MEGENKIIDYEKLKEAHELADKSSGYFFNITLGMNDGIISLYDAENASEQFICNPDSLDELIEKLKELTHPDASVNQEQSDAQRQQDAARSTLSRIREYMNDKELAEKCGLSVEDICNHEPEMNIGNDDRPRNIKGHYPMCKKCGTLYK